MKRKSNKSVPVIPDSRATRAAKQEERNAAMFVAEFNKLCDRLGYVIVAEAGIQQIDTSTFKAVAQLRVAKKRPCNQSLQNSHSRRDFDKNSRPLLWQPAR